MPSFIGLNLNAKIELLHSILDADDIQFEGVDSTIMLSASEKIAKVVSKPEIVSVLLEVPRTSDFSNSCFLFEWSSG